MEQADPSQFLHQVSFTVCHGGAGTVYQSLAHGVPLLCLPSNPDQGLISGQVATQGAGITVLPKHVSVARIAQVTNELIHAENFRKKASTLSCAIKKHDTRGHWQRFLSSVFSKVEVENGIFEACCTKEFSSPGIPTHQ
jgi:UDP:flavonoid glycosyltransferase YjiC (YdhE family)